ncbi:uncharacterized protein EHS24_003139 [Apiotrichum porosum]|uniref:Uncharacterized protein n=1 Tax=Apiotrichum porosum TaxID=105984 RepID=A0A427XFB2_9TREE|nr:uncharacterized protein EHS24_003139 [Apiotrichum porosum]RSH77579.1 hypothetical protein EHS24_003139 [Apiotrichum porosum]
MPSRRRETPAFSPQPQAPPTTQVDPLHGRGTTSHTQYCAGPYPPYRPPYGPPWVARMLAGGSMAAFTLVLSKQPQRPVSRAPDWETCGHYHAAKTVLRRGTWVEICSLAQRPSSTRAKPNPPPRLPSPPMNGRRVVSAKSVADKARNRDEKRRTGRMPGEAPPLRLYPRPNATGGD